MHVLKKRVLKKKRHIPKQNADKTCAERIKSFLLLFKFCGLFANNIRAGKVKRCSWPTYGICVFWISFFVLNLLYYCYIFSSFFGSEFSPSRIIIHFVKNFMGCISLSANVITTYSSQDHFNKFFDRLDCYDYKAVQIKKKRRDNLWIPRVVTLLLILVNLLLVNAIIYSKMMGDEFIIFYSILFDVCTMSIHMYGTLEKFLLLYLVLERFKHLNKDIAPNVSWDKERHEPNTIKISDVKIMHLMLYNAHEAFNDIYRNPLLLSFTSLMMCIVSNLSVFRKKGPLMGCSFVGPALILMLLMCIICHYTAEEANNVACVLNKSMTMLINSGNTMIKINALTYFLHNRVSFDAAGFFTIDLPLFQSIVGAISTYFIILV